MMKAQQGRIRTPERMAALYPIFREINIEMDETNAYWDSFERKEAKKAAANRRAKDAPKA